MASRLLVAEDTGERIVPMRLQKFLARAGVASRRGSENLMTAGRVRVNGEVVTELGSKVDPAVDVVTVDGVEVSLGDGSVYLILNKPAGYVTTMRDPGGRRCVAELVPTKQYPGLFPVGRLDRDTTGLLLFTTDGEAAQKLLHPSFEKDKHYLALIEGELTDAEKLKLKAGITLDDGPCSPAGVHTIALKSPDAKKAIEAFSGYAGISVKFARVPAGTSIVELVIHEGRKHQVKRMLAAVGHEVLALHRASFGPLELTGVRPGEWRMLTEEEKAALAAATR
jgi:23S rRNA pseudouridine2605 synthase